ncbi:pyridoxamine 5'-phosphate oxidase family protein [bacterium]|nr:MAG: pyridoxamine 5'-phosphate oxidase family protein [bacterium]
MVNTIDHNGFPHSACKGIVEIKSEGIVYLLDLYKGVTYANLQNNHHASISMVNEHKFIGYCLKGKAKIEKTESLPHDVILAWDKQITSRISQRLIRNVRGEKGHSLHPEAALPKPKYLIVMEIESVVDLKPQHIKGE